MGFGFKGSGNSGAANIDVLFNSVLEGSANATIPLNVNLTDGVSDIVPTSVGLTGNDLNIVILPPPTTGDYIVRFFDIDGTVLKEQFVNIGQDATAPDNPTYDPTYLTFAEWNQPFTNVQNDIDVGAIYDTIDGKSYLFVRVTDVTGLQPTIYLNKTGTALLTIDWGDSTTSTTTTNGSFNLTKSSPYASVGDYVISIQSANNYGNQSGLNYFNGNNNYARILIKCYEGLTHTNSGFVYRYCGSLKYISINKNNIIEGRCIEATSLIHCNMPKNSNSLSNGFFLCDSLESVSIPKTVLGYNGAFYGCNSLKKAIISGCNNLAGNTPFYQCYSLTEIVLPNTLTVIVSSTFFECKSLKTIKIGNATTEIQAGCFFGCTSLRSLEFPSTLVSISGANVFLNNTSTLEYTFLSVTPPTLASTSSFSGINPACKIYVPDGSVAAYKAATNWVTYANYIYPLSTKP
jgi:hypothetical protein